MTLRLEQLVELVDEVLGRLATGVVREVRAPGEEQVVVTFHVDGQDGYLLFDVRPRLTRFHLIPARTATQPQPAAFVMQLRKELTGLPLRDIRLPSRERIVHLSFGTQEEEWALLLEVSGHHPNLFLLDPQGIIRGVLSQSRSHRRDLIVGRPYVFPLETAESSTLPPVPASDPKGEGPTSPSERIAESYRKIEEALAQGQLHARLTGWVGRELKKTRGTLARIAQDHQRCLESSQYREWGELIKGSLHKVKVAGGMLEAVRYDAEGPTEVLVPLLPGKGPVETMNEYFKRHRRGQRGLSRVEERQRELEARLLRFEALSTRLGTPLSLPELEHLAQSLPVKGQRSVRSGPQGGAQGHRCYREFQSSTGRRILVGRAGKDNHELTFKVASPHDAWMHVRGFAGAHVVIPLSRGQEVDAVTLLEAAHLAIAHSKAPSSGYCEVLWTHRKFVRAIPKGPPGKVTVSREHALSFDFDPSALPRALVDIERD